MPFRLRAQLSLLFFVKYFAAGVWMVSLGTYMSKTLVFDSIIATSYSMVGFATIIATLFVGMVADRYFDAKKVLMALSIAASASLFFLSGITESKTIFLIAMLIHCMFYISSVPLISAIAFNVMSDPGQQYPGIRALGSVGWIVGGLLVGTMPGAALTTLPMLLGAGAYFLLGLYALTLPNTPPKAKGQKTSIAGLFGLDVLGKVRDASFWIFIVCVILIVIPKKFYDSFANTFLTEKGMSFTAGSFVFEPTAIQTLGQVAEALMMLMIPFLIRNIGIKWVMVIGIVGWVTRFLLFAYGFNGDQAIVSMLLIGILLHGLSYDFFFVSGQIYVDRLYGAEMRARVQAFYFFIMSGLGVVLGSLVAQQVFGFFALSGDHRDWKSVWLAPALVASLVGLWFAWKFQEPKALQDTPPTESQVAGETAIAAKT
jgi:nucleoside transporter